MNSRNNFALPKLDFQSLNKRENDYESRSLTARNPRSSDKELDYTFKSTNKKNSRIESGKLEEYVYDLENTWSLNIDMLNNMINDFSNFPYDQKKKLFAYIQKIKDVFVKKKKLREDKQKLRGKVLMDKQIMEEFKRRCEENNVYYQEQVDEYLENCDKKDSFIKQFEKKFNEVEIYVQREAKAKPEEWNKFTKFEIVPFIYSNEMLQHQALRLKEEIKSSKDDMTEILQENIELKKRDEFIDMSDEYDNQKSKYNSLINLYNCKIKFLERNSEHLRQVLKNVNTKLNDYSLFKESTDKQLKPKETDPDHSNHHRRVSSINLNQAEMKKLYAKNIPVSKASIFNDSNRLDLSILKQKNDDQDTGPHFKYSNKELSSFSKNNRKRKATANSNNDDNSMILRTPEFNNINKENWDISCIENLGDL